MSTSSNGASRKHRSLASSAKDAPSTTPQLLVVELSRIHVEEGFNPRQHFDEAELERLAESIRLRGMLQPLVVSPNGGDDFRLVAGERRYRAAALASLTEVPVIVWQVNEDTRGLDDALVENMTRKELDAVEEAKGFQRLLDGGLTRKGVAELLGVSHKRIGDRLLILGLPEELHARIADGTIPPSAVKPLAELAKAHPGLPAVAVTCVTEPAPESYYESPTWTNLVEDPVEVIAYGASDEHLPPDVYRSGGSYPLERFTLTDTAAKDLKKLFLLKGIESEGLQLRLGRESLEQALALKAAIVSSQNGHISAAFIVGQDIADQLASDQVSTLLKQERSRQRRERESERNRTALAGGGGGSDVDSDDSEEPVEPVDDPAEQRRREAAERAERKREAVAFNAELGAAVYGKLSRIKVDERVLEVLSAVGFHADLGQLAARGARYGFPGWPVETTTKGGKPKVEYLGTNDSAAKAREYLAGAKTAGDVAGRLFALVVMAVYARQEAVAKSAQVPYDVRFYSDTLPWSHEVVTLVEQIAEERLPAALTDPRKAARKQAERDERERRKADQVAATAKKELVEQLPTMTAEERSAALKQFRDEHGWGEHYWDLQSSEATLNRADEEAAAAANAPAGAAGGDESDASPEVDDSELDYSDGDPSEEADSELVAT